MDHRHERPVFFDPKRKRWPRFRRGLFAAGLLFTLVFGGLVASVIVNPVLPALKLPQSTLLPRGGHLAPPIPASPPTSAAGRRFVEIKRRLESQRRQRPEVLHARNPGASDRPMTIGFFVNWDDIFVFQVLFPPVSPVMDLLVIVSLAAAAVGRWQHPSAFSSDTMWRVLFYYAVFQAIDFLSAVLAFVLERRENFRLLVLLFWQRFFYRQLMYYVAIRAILASLRGGAVGWNKVERKATVSQI